MVAAPTEAQEGERGLVERQIYIRLLREKRDNLVPFKMICGFKVFPHVALRQGR